MFKQFITPHSHPQSLDSASTPEAFAKREVELGGAALTCTDHGSLSAVYKIYELAKKNNLTPVLGTESYFRSDDCPILTKFGIPKTNTVPRGSDAEKWAKDHPDGSFVEHLKYLHATIGFRDFKAYKVGVRLLSKADARAEQHGSERKPIWGWPEIEELAAHNVTIGSGCIVGMVSRHLLNSDVPKDIKVGIATAYFERLHHLFKDRFFVEVFPHECTHEFTKGVFIDVEKDDGTKETIRYYFDKTIRTDAGTSTAEALADKYDPNKHKFLVSVCNYRVWTDFEKPLKILAVKKVEGFIQNECAPWAPGGDLQYGANVFAMEMAKRYNVPILCSGDEHFAEPKHKLVQDVRLAQMGNWRFYNSYHRMASSEAYAHFKKVHNTSEKEFEGWIDNSYAWLDGFKGFVFDNTPQLPTKFFPKDSLAYTKELINKHGRMKNDPVYLDRLKKEIDILHKNGKIDLLPYFFIDEEICRVYRNQGSITSPGRGSGGGLLLAYLMSITHLDPIKENLSLERFINKARIEANSLPDLDQDLPHRDLLVGYDCDVIEVSAADGSKHVLPEDFKIETDQGIMPIKDAIAKQADFKAWW